MRCVACHRPYRQMLAFAAGAVPHQHACECGNTTFEGTVGGEAPLPGRAEPSDEELRALIVRACNVNLVDVTQAELSFARALLAAHPLATPSPLVSGGASGPALAMSGDAAALMMPHSSEQRMRRDRFEASSDGRSIDDDDFIYDASMRVYGDFESDEQRKSYTDALCAILNSTLPATPSREAEPTPDKRLAAAEPVGMVLKRLRTVGGIQETIVGPELFEAFKDLPANTYLYAEPPDWEAKLRSFWQSWSVSKEQAEPLTNTTAKGIAVPFMMYEQRGLTTYHVLCQKAPTLTASAAAILGAAGVDTLNYNLHRHPGLNDPLNRSEALILQPDGSSTFIAVPHASNGSGR